MALQGIVNASATVSAAATATAAASGGAAASVAMATLDHFGVTGDDRNSGAAGGSPHVLRNPF